MDGLSNSRYYKGGFEPRMTRREASLILAVSPSAPSKKVKDSHKRIMLLNHPDRGERVSIPDIVVADAMPFSYVVRRITLSGSQN